MNLLPHGREQVHASSTMRMFQQRFVPVNVLCRCTVKGSERRIGGRSYDVDDLMAEGDFKAYVPRIAAAAVTTCS